MPAGIPRVREGVVSDEASLMNLARETGFPLVMKVVGPVHKSDVGGVALGIRNDQRTEGPFSPDDED